ncbi:MAG: HAD family phosphatase [Pseudobacteriovorax sp.]|nr:HAD family phosphatase [Pseudobacteriovorax sp.]
MDFTKHKVPIDTIIFDFGGVILDIEYEKTEAALRELLAQEGGFSQATQTQIFDDIETGQITPEQFRGALRHEFKCPDIKDQDIDIAWNLMLGPIQSEKIEILREARKHYRIFLLSNTNAIHLEAIQQTMTDAAGSPSAFEELFENVYYSHVVGMRKPHAPIFQHVIEGNNLDPSRSLFIDDSRQHVVGAKQCGLVVHHLTGRLEDFWRDAQL